MASHKIEEPIALIGGCGFFGAKLVERLLDDGSKNVHILDIRTQHNRLPGANYHQVDISSAQNVLDLLHQIEPKTVFHSATPPPTLKDHQLYTRVNVDGTRNVLAAAKASGVTAYIYTSSASVAHDNLTDLYWGDESLPILRGIEQKEPYSETKGIAEEFVLQANNYQHPGGKTRLLTTVIRPVSIFGPGDPGVTTAMCTSAKDGKFRVQMGDGKNRFDFVYVDNLVDGHMLAASAIQEQAHAATASSESRVAGESFIITNDDPYLFWGFARALGAAAGYPTDENKVRIIPKWLGLWIGYIAEWAVWLRSFGRKTSTLSRLSINYSTISRTWRIDKAKQRLGYRPLISMEEGIARAGKWFASQQNQTKKDL